MATKIALDMVNKDKTRVAPKEDEERRTSFNLGEGLGLSNGETRKKFDNILTLTEAEELNDDYVNVYSTCALVGALVMSFLAPAASARIEAKPDNIWGEALTPYVIEANQILVVVAFFFSFLMVFLACVMLAQLAHIPKSETRLLFQQLGDARVHAPLSHMQKLMAMYGFHFLLSTSLCYHMYTSIVAFVVTVLGIGYSIYSATGMIKIKTRTLEMIRDRVSNNQSKAKTTM